MRRAPSLAQGCATPAVGGHQTVQCPANDNARVTASDNAHGPIVILTPIGDGVALARTLARVLVQRELILTNAIPDPVHCKDQRTAG